MELKTEDKTPHPPGGLQLKAVLTTKFEERLPFLIPCLPGYQFILLASGS